ncbi:GntR family transcriptional regulator [Glycomyces sp. NPDC047369]
MPRKKQSTYEKIASHYRDLIENGELTKGDKLPSVSQMCAEWNVATATINAAVNLLKSEGLIEVRRGARATVREVVPLVRIAPERYFRPHTKPTWMREAERAGRAPEIDYRSERIEAPAEIAERLGIEDGGAVIRTRYLIKMDGEPVSMSAAYEPYSLVGGTEIERPHEGPMANRGIVPRFDHLQVFIDEVEEVLKFRAPTQEEGEALQIAKTDRVVEIAQTFRADGLAVETADITFVADRYELRYRMQIPIERVEEVKSYDRAGQSTTTTPPAETDAPDDPRSDLPWPFGTLGG